MVVSIITMVVWEVMEAASSCEISSCVYPTMPCDISQHSTLHSFCHKMQKTSMVKVLKTARWIIREIWIYSYISADTCYCWCCGGV